MKKLFSVFVFFVFGLVFLGTKNTIYAADCSTYNITLTGNIDGRVFQAGEPSNNITFTVNNVANSEYILQFRGNLMNGGTTSTTRSAQVSGGSFSFSESSATLLNPGNWTINLIGPGIGGLNNSCELANYEVQGARCQSVSVFQNRSDIGDPPMCFGGNGGGCLDASHPVTVRSVTYFGEGNTPFLGRIIHDKLGTPLGTHQGNPDPSTGILETSHGPFDAGQHTIIVRQDASLGSNPELCRISFNININCNNVPEENQCVEDEPIFNGGSAETVGPDTFSLCKQIPESQPEQRAACEACTGGTADDEANEGVWTAVGCINRDPQAVIRKFISVGLGMGGGVALLTFLAAGFIYSTSQGDPKAYGKAKEMMTAAVVGLIFIIFSVTILQFTGSTILRIPGFGG